MNSVTELVKFECGKHDSCADCHQKFLSKFEFQCPLKCPLELNIEIASVLAYYKNILKADKKSMITIKELMLRNKNLEKNAIIASNIIFRALLKDFRWAKGFLAVVPDLPWVQCFDFLASIFIKVEEHRKSKKSYNYKEQPFFRPFLLKHNNFEISDDILKIRGLQKIVLDFFKHFYGSIYLAGILEKTNFFFCSKT